MNYVGHKLQAHSFVEDYSLAESTARILKSVKYFDLQAFFSSAFHSSSSRSSRPQSVAIAY